MQDRYGRTIDSLRLSLNRACNLRCFYCHNEGQYDGSKGMTPLEIQRLIEVASRLGIKRLKLTGGEPLLRPDVADIVRQVAPLVQEVSMTTNGVYLPPLAQELKAAGLARVNISIDSLDPIGYRRICGSYNLVDAMAGLDAALENGLTPVKLNMVLLKGFNESELPSMMGFAARKGAVLQVIEYVINKEDLGDKRYADHHVDLAELEAIFERKGELVGTNHLHGRKRYRMDTVPATRMWPGKALDRPVEVEFVRPMHNKAFCKNCKRIRITSSGRIKGCLFQEQGTVDALGPLRAGADDTELVELFTKVVNARRPYWAERIGEDGPSEPSREEGERCVSK
jgi:cyclic pyranopterin phosphate synthase